MATNGCHSYYRLYCKKQGQCGGDYCVTVRNGKLCLARPNNADCHQRWYKDASYKNGVMLVNQSNGHVVKHSGNGVQLQLVRKPCGEEKSVMWKESADVGHGYRFLKTVSDGSLVMDAQFADIQDGQLIISYPSKINNEATSVENQLWKLVPC